MNFTIPSDRLSQIKLWILMPTRTLNALCPHHVTLLGRLRQHGIWYSLRTLPGDSLVTRARNNLADVFLNESTDDENHFSLWLDDDILFDPESVLQLLAIGRDFVTAPYTKKALHMDRMAAAAKLDWKSEDLPSVAGTPNVNFLINNLRLDEPTPVLEAGSGFWLVKRKVFRMMSEQLPIRYTRTHEEKAHFGRPEAHDFFRVGIWPDVREYLSEDWWFCREWRKLGGTVWCCFWIKTCHIGPYMFKMDMDAIIGLLNSTGGYIHGPTWAEENNEKRSITNHGTEDSIEHKSQGSLGETQTGSSDDSNSRNGKPGPTGSSDQPGPPVPVTAEAAD